MPDAQWPLRLSHWRGQGRTSLRQSENLSGEGRGRQSPGPDRLRRIFVENGGMVIVGAGECGARAALTLREQGWDGKIALIGEEALPPYERPPLSKAVMVTDPEPAPAHPLTSEAARERRIDLISGVRVTQIDRNAHEVVLGDGRRIAYGKLLLATGAQPRKLMVEGAESGAVLY